MIPLPFWAAVFCLLGPLAEKYLAKGNKTAIMEIVLSEVFFMIGVEV